MAYPGLKEPSETTFHPDARPHWILRLFTWLIHAAFGTGATGKQNLIQAILLLVIYGSLAAGLGSVVTNLEAMFCVFFCLLGLWVGWSLAVPTLPAYQAFAFGIVVLFGTQLLIVGQLGEILLRAITLLSALGTFHSPAASLSGFAQSSQQVIMQAEFFMTLEQSARGPIALLVRFATWLINLPVSGQILDPTSLAMGWSTVIFLSAAWGAWWVKRTFRPIIGILPGLALLGASLSYARGSELYLLFYLAGTLLLLGNTHYQGLIQRWSTRLVDYSEEIYLDLSLMVSGITLAITLLAWTSPNLSPHRIQEYLEQFRPGSSANQGQPGLGIQPPAIPPTPDAYSELRQPGLPTVHLLRAGLELRQAWVMNVRTGELPPRPQAGFEQVPPNHYWRGVVYDRYTGFGWTSTSTNEQSYQAQKPVIADLDEAQAITTNRLRSLRQEVTLAPGRYSDEARYLIYSAGELYSTNEGYTVAWYRQPGADVDNSLSAFFDSDRFAASTTTNNYIATSLESIASAAELRRAGEAYPDWVVGRYLQLPGNLPDSVRALARDLSALELTPYDRVKAIETYLRQFPYTLDLPDPPTNRDVVDYFLFDLRKGYCDYYASAMVVLARAIGVPARLAVGFASGQYNFPTATYIVTEENAHSWPEIYFPGYGWIAFEPTAGLPPLDHETTVFPQPGQLVPSRPQDRPGAIPYNRLVVWGLLALLAGLYLFLLFNMLETWRLRRLAPAECSRQLFKRLYRGAVQLGVPVNPARTPRELHVELHNILHRLARSKPWNRWLSSISQDVQILIELYNESIYSQDHPGRPAQETGLQAWKRLRWLLTLAWLRQLVERT